MAVALFLVCGLPCHGRAGLIDPHKQEVDVLYERAFCEGKLQQNIQELQGLIEDSGKKLHAREYAVEKLGQLLRAQHQFNERAYFLGLARQASEDPDIRLLRSAILKEFARVGVQELQSEPERIEELTRLLTFSYEEFAAKRARRWAADELCSLGVEEALPLIRKVYFDYRKSDAGLQAKVCTWKVRLLKQHPSRLDALTAALQVAEEEASAQVRRWAVEGISEIEGSQAEDVLRRIAAGEFAMPGTPSLEVVAVQGLKARNWTYGRLMAVGVDPKTALQAGLYPEWAEPRKAAEDPCAGSSSSPKDSQNGPTIEPLEKVGEARKGPAG